jgi:hypothetical protein
MIIAKITLDELTSRFPNTDTVYLEAIVNNLKPEDYDILDGVEKLPDFIDGIKRLEMANLSNYNKPYEFEGYDNTKRIDYEKLNQCLDEILGCFKENKDKKRKFVIGGIVHQYLKAKGVVDDHKNDSKTRKENFRIRRNFAMKFYSKNEAIIEAIKQKNVSRQDAGDIIEQLADSLDLVDNASRKIKEIYETIPAKELLEGKVKVKIWDRDPSKDMSYVKEFKCSAFLGTKKGNEHAPKYLKNAAASMVDFTMNLNGEEVRLVRAITGACAERNNQHLTGRTYMLVDSVEGSGGVNDEVIFDALNKYAKHSGFDGIVFFRKPRNERPQKFIRYIETQKLNKGELRMQLLSSKGHEYFEGLLGAGIVGPVNGYVIDF